MKPQERWITRPEAAKQLGISMYELDNLRASSRIAPLVRPGRRRPEYRESDVLALKRKLESELLGS